MDLRTIKTFDNAMETHLLKATLENEGIRCYIFDENIVSINPLFNQTVGGIKLKVESDDYDNANELINRIDNLKIINENGEIVKCPACESEDYYSGYKSMKGYKGIFSMIISFLFFIFPFYFKTVNKCKQCGEEFIPDDPSYNKS